MKNFKIMSIWQEKYIHGYYVLPILYQPFWKVSFWCRKGMIICIGEKYNFLKNKILRESRHWLLPVVEISFLMKLSTKAFYFPFMSWDMEAEILKSLFSWENRRKTRTALNHPKINSNVTLINFVCGVHCGDWNL